MKKGLFLILFLVTLSGYAQNLQLNYDFGRTKNGNVEQVREYFTSTIEMFRPDSFGSTFFFVDMDYDPDNGGVQLAYCEIARNIKLFKLPVELHVEYNGGNFMSLKGNYFGYINRAWIIGANYPFAVGNVFCSAYAGYKNIYGAHNGADFQVTGTWFTNLLNNKLTITGFIDIWSQDKFGTEDKNIVILTEPQIWFNATKNLSIGGEIEISKNFITTDDDFDFMPAAGLKWNF